MKNILVTGGLGYVGGRIVNQLLASGGYKLFITTRKKQADPLKWFGTGDVTFLDAAAWESPQAGFPVHFDAVIHLAAFNEIDSQANPVAAAEYNIVSSLKLLQKAVSGKTGQFIYCSTAHVYGSPLAGRISEQVVPRPVHPYAITHRAFEDFVLAARDKEDTQGIVLRLSNSLGAPLWPEVNRWTLLVNDLCKQAVMTGRLTLLSSGMQQRDFITLTDVAAAVEFFLTKESHQTGDGLFNLGGNYTSTVLDMTRLIASRCKAVLGLEVSLEIPAPRGQEPGSAIPLEFSSEKLSRIGFHWSGSVEQEIDGLLLFCRHHFNPAG